LGWADLHQRLELSLLDGNEPSTAVELKWEKGRRKSTHHRQTVRYNTGLEMASYGHRVQTHCSGQTDGLTVDFDMIAPTIKVARMSNIPLSAYGKVIHALSCTVDTEAE
jgi:hypothetical protein